MCCWSLKSSSNTSVGFPINPASPPASPAHATVEVEVSFPPDICLAFAAKKLYNAKRAVEYVVCRSIEAESPDQSERIPLFLK
jgi:hypothetical protein